MADGLTRRTLRGVYQDLLGAYGPQHWWPAEEPFEVMVGAVLTQSTSWRNAELAIDRLKAAAAMTPEALRSLPLSRLASLVRPSGYYNAKARKLQALAVWLGEEYQDDIGRLASAETGSLRRQLLAVHGIGEETADSIILYAANQPVFVIDAYTRRIFDRIFAPLAGPRDSFGERSDRFGGRSASFGERSDSFALPLEGDSYPAYQRLFMDTLPRDTALFNEYHALLVRHGKDVCRKNPRCRRCCLRGSRCRFSDSNQEEEC